MIDLEGIAAKLANSLYGDSDMDEIEKAKIEYGFSLTIGLALTIVLALVPAAILGTFSTLMLMMAALVTRLFSGGPLHKLQPLPFPFPADLHTFRESLPNALLARARTCYWLFSVVF